MEGGVGELADGLGHGHQTHLHLDLGGSWSRVRGRRGSELADLTARLARTASPRRVTWKLTRPLDSSEAASDVPPKGCGSVDGGAARNVLVEGGKRGWKESHQTTLSQIELLSMMR